MAFTMEQAKRRLVWHRMAMAELRKAQDNKDFSQDCIDACDRVLGFKPHFRIAGTRIDDISFQRMPLFSDEKKVG